MRIKPDQNYLFPTRIDIHPDKRTLTINLLNQTLANTIDLKTQVKQAHWNVKGNDFYQLHLLFDEIARELEEFTDLVAERITALGGPAFGTTRVVADKSILEEYPLDIVDGTDHLIALAERIAVYGRTLRVGIAQSEQIGEKDTNDLYIQLSRAIDKRLWFLEAHLIGGNNAPSNVPIHL